MASPTAKANAPSFPPAWPQFLAAGQPAIDVAKKTIDMEGTRKEAMITDQIR